MRNAAIAFLLVTALGGCAVGPDYERPALALSDAQWSELPPVFDIESLPPAEFWKGFEDEVLNDLVAQALEQSMDINAAAARVDEARAGRRAAGGAFLPQIGANLEGQRASPSLQGANAASGLVAAGVLDRVIDDFNSGLQIGWEIDLFGRLRRAREAADANLAASQADLEAVRLLVASEVSRAYLRLRGAQAQLAVVSENVRLQRETVQLTEAKTEQWPGAGA